jgi:hypothetical protein
LFLGLVLSCLVLSCLAEDNLLARSEENETFSH